VPLSLATLRRLPDHAAEHGHGLPAFDVSSVERVPGIVAAVRPTAAPVILQASRGARGHAGAT
jgi:fructose-bisphosphate aldolase class II